MDVEELREEIDAWVEDGIVTPEQAAAIRARYEGADAPNRTVSDAGDDGGASRFVLVVAAMGATLVGAGTIWLLWEHWGDLPRLLRTALAVLAPVAFAVAGARLTREGPSRVGSTLWVLAAVVAGASLFLLADLWAPTLDAAWPFLGWATVALAIGRVRDSRPATAVGLAALVGAVADLEPGGDLPVAVGLLGVAFLALTVATPARASPAVADAHRLVGTAAVGGSLLLVAAADGRYDAVGVAAEPGALALALLALAGVAAAWQTVRRGERSWLEGGWPLAALVATAVSTGAVSLVPPLPGLLAFVLVHASLFALVVATAAVAVEIGSPALVNLVAVVFGLQVLAFLGTRILEATTGAGALVLVGALVLALALALERGRRRALARMGH